ncbi:hypothetical protein DFH06DRAFT_1179472 [Mycena polygramma]|nr:hypothetical protein DFH06DRAFT_1179472 [Mycena polygramma]
MAQCQPLPPLVLPQELEREIFEIAALSYPSSIPRFMLVAWRVRSWVEPLLYRTIMLCRMSDMAKTYLIHSKDTLLPLLVSKSDAFLTGALRNLLFLWMNAGADGQLVLSRCRGIENLFIGRSRSRSASGLLSLVDGLPLRRLHCKLAQLFDSMGQVDFTHRLFAQITHLEILDGYGIGRSEIWHNIARIPHLTHLSFYDPNFVDIWLTLLRTCPCLCILIGVGSLSGFQSALKAQNELVEDRRVVLVDCGLPVTDWKIGAYTGNDRWARAEELVAKRRSGQVDAYQYTLKYDVRSE